MHWHRQQPHGLGERFLSTETTCGFWITALNVEKPQVVCTVLLCCQVLSSTAGLGLHTGSKKKTQQFNIKNRALRIPKQWDKAHGSEIPNTFKNCIFQPSFQLENFRKTIFSKPEINSPTCSNNTGEREAKFCSMHFSLHDCHSSVLQFGLHITVLS